MNIIHPPHRSRILSNYACYACICMKRISKDWVYFTFLVPESILLKISSYYSISYYFLDSVKWVNVNLLYLSWAIGLVFKAKTCRKAFLKNCFISHVLVFESNSFEISFYCILLLIV